MTRQLAELRHATRVLMIRHRVIRWTPLAQPQNLPVVIPEWRRRLTAKDLTSMVLG